MAQSVMTHKHWNVTCVKTIQYNIETTTNIFASDNSILLSGGRRTNSRRFVIVDSVVYDLYGQQIINYFSVNNIQINIMRFVAGEQNKSLRSYKELLQTLEKYPIDRRSEPIIAIGGGVLTDLVSFLASTYRRGVPHIKVPTTLMGYIDAAIGIKTGINTPNYKNRIGSFEPPYKVILDKAFLSSLSKRHILNGMAEIIKLAIIGDLTLFEHLEKLGQDAVNTNFQNKHGMIILESSITGILKFLEPNLYEDVLARELDFGHTFSPAMEMIAKDLLHGEAVVVDVMISSILSYIKKILSQKSLERILNLINTLGFTLNFDYVSPDLMLQSLIERTHHRDGCQNVPLPNEIGQCIFINDLTKEDINAVCSFLKSKKNTRKKHVYLS